MVLEKERAFFETKKQELLKHHPGKVALIVGEELLGVFDTRDAAYAAGLEAKGNVPMFIQEITPEGEAKGSIPALVLGLIGLRSL